MLGRLKFDLTELTNEMLSHLPNSVFESDSTTFLDPAMGGGQFLRAVADKLRKYGHSEENIASRLFGMETHEWSVRYAKKIGTPGWLWAGGLADLAEMEKMGMKFDVILGNPPYQKENKTHNGKKKVGNKLWYQFIYWGDKIVKENGYVTMITPNQWLSGGVNMRKGKFGVLKDVFAKKQMIIAVVMNLSKKHFSNVGISIGWWVYKNTPITSNTKLIMEDGEFFANLTGISLLSPMADRNSTSIVAKTLGANNDKYDSYYFNAYVPIGEYKETDSPTKINKYPHWIVGSNVTGTLEIRYFPKILNTNVHYKKILFPMSNRYWQPYLANKDIGVASLGQALKVADNTTEEGFKSVFYSKLFTYLCYNLQIQQNGFMKSIYVQSLPKLDLSRTWTDAELYQHFGLTQEEIDYIEANTK